jgi:hypothetical protein
LLSPSKKPVIFERLPLVNENSACQAHLRCPENGQRHWRKIKCQEGINQSINRRGLSTLARTCTAGFEMALQIARHVLFYLGEVQTFFEINIRNWFAF